jgi:hypothetical protein
MSHPDPYGVGHRGIIGSAGAPTPPVEYARRHQSDETITIPENGVALGKWPRITPAQYVALREDRNALLAVVRAFMDVVEEPPPANCTCHISPPCRDCVDHSALREAFAAARLALGD